MATGRTVKKFTRFYANGFDLSGYTHTFGPLEQVFAGTPMAALTDEVQNVLNGHATIKVGTLNGFFDNTATSGLHAVANAPGSGRTIMCPIGIRAAPAQADPVFAGIFEQLNYYAVPGDGFVTATLEFGARDLVSGSPAYDECWGYLLHARGAETAANTAIGFDDGLGGPTTKGGIFAYQLFSSNGTVTLTAQDAATNTNPSFANITNATSGSIDASTTPVSGHIELGVTATIRQFLRWQLAFGTATTANFAAGFIRGR